MLFLHDRDVGDIDDSLLDDLTAVNEILDVEVPTGFQLKVGDVGQWVGGAWSAGAAWARLVRGSSGE